MVKVFIFILILSLYGYAFSAETITFKSGRVIEADIIEQIDDYIRVDFNGVILTYYLDEIESIDGKRVDIKIAEEQHLEQGNYYFENREIDKAISEYQKALEVNPTSVIARENLCYAYGFAGQEEKAMECCKKAIQQNPEYYGFYECVSSRYMQLRNFKEAIYYGQKAVALKPESALANLLLAKCYEKKEDYQKARKYFQRLKNIFEKEGDIEGSRNIQKMIEQLPK